VTGECPVAEAIDQFRPWAEEVMLKMLSNIHKKRHSMASDCCGGGGAISPAAAKKPTKITLTCTHTHNLAAGAISKGPPHDHVYERSMSALANIILLAIFIGSSLRLYTTLSAYFYEQTLAVMSVLKFYTL